MAKKRRPVNDKNQVDDVDSDEPKPISCKLKDGSGTKVSTNGSKQKADSLTLEERSLLGSTIIDLDRFDNFLTEEIGLTFATKQQHLRIAQNLISGDGFNHEVVDMSHNFCQLLEDAVAFEERNFTKYKSLKSAIRKLQQFQRYYVDKFLTEGASKEAEKTFQQGGPQTTDQSASLAEQDPTDVLEEGAVADQVPSMDHQNEVWV